LKDTASLLQLNHEDISNRFSASSQY